MEVEIKPISLDTRLEYLQQISENQKKNANKFPFFIVVVAFFIGAGFFYVINTYWNTKQEKSKS